MNKIKFTVLGTFVTTILLAFGANCQDSHGREQQTTNSIPSGIFVTDDGRLFWHTSQKETAVAVKKIKDAQSSPESLPADKDPNGHWGVPTNGIQLSLRFENQSYLVGSNITASILIRNVSEMPVRYLRSFVSNRPSPINVLAWKDGALLHTKGDTEPFSVSAVTELTLAPKTQHKYQVNLRNFYDLTQPGNYVSQASYAGPTQAGESTITSKPVTVLIKTEPN